MINTPVQDTSVNTKLLLNNRDMGGQFIENMHAPQCYFNIIINTFFININN